MRYSMGDFAMLEAFATDPDWLRDFCEVYTDFTITHNVNEVTRLYSPDPDVPGEPFGGTNRVEEGHPIGEFYMYEYLGVDAATGRGLFTDLDADGNVIGTTFTPSSSDRLFVGTPHPKYYGGFRNTEPSQG